MRITLDLHRSPKWRLHKLRAHYEQTIEESQIAIRKIDSILSSREAQSKYKRQLKQYGMTYVNFCENGLDRSLIEKIMHDLSCDENYALQVAEIAKKEYLRSERSKRDKRIVIMAEFMPKKEIAEKENLSRQQVHNILKKAS